MKNIHVLPTDKPSRLFEILQHNLLFDSKNMYSEDYKKLHIYKNKHIYITSDEEIKEGVNQWYLDKYLNKPYNSGGAQYSPKQDVIILTTDQDLIKEGVQAIDDEFLEWFVKNPSCEEVEVNNYHVKGDVSGKLHYKIIIPKKETEFEDSIENSLSIMSIANDMFGKKEEPKQETLEEAKKYLSNEGYGKGSNFTLNNVANLMLEWQQEQDKNKYSEEEVKIMYRSLWAGNCFDFDTSYEMETSFEHDFNLWFEQFKNK